MERSLRADALAHDLVEMEMVEAEKDAGGQPAIRARGEMAAALQDLEQLQHASGVAVVDVGEGLAIAFRYVGRRQDLAPHGRSRIVDAAFEVTLDEAGDGHDRVGWRIGDD